MLASSSRKADDMSSETLKKIVRQYGRIVLRDGRQFKNLLSDLEPDARRRNLILRAHEAGVVELLEKAEDGQLALAVAVAQACQVLERDWSTDPASAREIVELWSEALGLQELAVPTHPPALDRQLTPPNVHARPEPNTVPGEHLERRGELSPTPSGVMPSGGPTTIRFRGKGYAFPAVCSCCLAPTTRKQADTSTRTVGIPLVAAHKTTITFEFPFCEVCAKKKADVSEKTSVWGCLPMLVSVVAIIIAFTQNLTGAGMWADYLVIGGGIIVGFVMIMRSDSQAIASIRDADPTHPPYCTEGTYPVDLRAWSSFDDSVFDIKNPEFAQLTVDRGYAQKE